MTGTTISYEQKKNAAKALRALESYRGKQLELERVHNQPVRRGRVHRHEYRLEAVESAVSLLEALNTDIGERSPCLKAMTRAFQQASMAQTERTLKDKDQAVLFDAIELAERELRGMVGDNKAADKVNESHSDKPVLTIHLTDMTATFKGKQYQFDQSQQWTALQKMARWPASPVKMTAVQATRLRQMLSSIGVPNLKKVIHKAGEDRYAMRTSDFRVEIEPPPSPEN